MTLLRAIGSAIGRTRQDARYALRSLMRAPGFTLAALVVLALGIGANAAIFSVVDAVLLKPMPYRDADRLMTVWHIPPQAGFPGLTRFSVSPANYFDWKQRQHVFEAMALTLGGTVLMTGPGEPVELTGTRVSKEFFPLLGVRFALGRGFLPEEEVPGRNQVAVLSHALWQSRFGGDRSVIGQTVLLNDARFQIVGVMDEAFDKPVSAQIWVPLALPPPARAVRNGHNMNVYARLAPGVTLEQARAEMTSIASALEREYPEDNTGWGATVIPLRESMLGDMRVLLLVLTGAVGFILLIACANVANLILARSIAKRSEMAVRLALGASPWTVARLVLTEATVLGLAAGALGLALAGLSLRAMSTFLGTHFPQTVSATPGWGVAMFTLGVSLMAGVCAGLWPALRLARASLADAVKEGGDRGDSDASGSRIRGVLVVAEVALSLMLLIGAGLMIRTIWQLNNVDPGFDSRGLVTARISIPFQRYPRPEQRTRFFDDVMTRVRALPDVDSAAMVNSLPLRGNPRANSWPVAVVGKPAVSVALQPNVHGNMVTPDYFRTLHIPLVRGRSFADIDRLDSERVVIISEAMARWLWPGEDPIGQSIFLAFLPDAPARKVVGIVRDIREEGLTGEGSASVYLPYSQVPGGGGTLVVRTRTPRAEGIEPALTGAVHAVDRDVPLLDVMTMDAIVARTFADKEATMFLLITLAALALVLAAVGIYSVLAYGVRRRVREIGIRIALGADRGGVTRMVVVDALRPTLIGIALGLAGAFALRQVMATMIYGVSAADPMTFAAVALLFVLVAIGASILPAFRASRVDPIVALRAD